METGTATSAKPVAAEGCAHGGPENGSSIDVQARKAAINEYLERERGIDEKYVWNVHQSEFRDERSQLFEVYWRVHKQLVDNDLFSILYANATEAVLADKMVDARRNVILAISLMKFVDNIQLTADSVVADLTAIMTDSGLVLFLWRKIPCSCLAEKKRDAKLSGKKIACFYCKKEAVPENVKKCGRCKHASYCSKECQKADWRGHKDDCKRFS